METEIFDEKLLEEYLLKKEKLKELEEDISYLSNKIKYILEQNKRSLVLTENYKIKLETQYEPNKDFMELLKKKGHSFVIKESCTMSDFKKTCKHLYIKESEQQRYLEPKKTKWLYVSKRTTK